VNQSEEALQRTEKEIIAEKAATLGRAGERLEAALGLVAELRQAFERATDPAARAWALAGYRQARSRALDARHTLIHHPARGHRAAQSSDSRSAVPRASCPRLTKQEFPGTTIG
jgi:hypothetical protein